MFLGTNSHAEYDGNNMNRVNNDVRTRNVNTTNDLNDNRDRNNNWAWLGLLGLAGLFGLRRRDKVQKHANVEHFFTNNNLFY